MPIQARPVTPHDHKGFSSWCSAGSQSSPSPFNREPFGATGSSPTPWRTWCLPCSHPGLLTTAFQSPRTPSSFSRAHPQSPPKGCTTLGSSEMGVVEHSWGIDRGIDSLGTFRRICTASSAFVGLRRRMSLACCRSHTSGLGPGRSRRRGDAEEKLPAVSRGVGREEAERPRSHCRKPSDVGAMRAVQHIVHIYYIYIEREIDYVSNFVYVIHVQEMCNMVQSWRRVRV